MGDLSDAMQDLVDDMKSSAEYRQVRISEMKSDTHNLLKRFTLEHQDMTAALKEKMSSDRAARREAAQQLMETTQQFISDTRADLQQMSATLREKLSSDRVARSEATQRFMEATQQFLSDTRADLQQMSATLREKLFSDRVARSEATQRFMEATRQFIDELASDHREAQNIWKERSVDMPGQSASEVIAPKKPVKGSGLKAVVEEKPTEEPEEKETASEDRILEVIAKHPEGIRLVDIGNELGVDWRGLIATVKPLVDEDRVEKIDSLYYPKN